MLQKGKTAIFSEAGKLLFSETGVHKSSVGITAFKIFRTVFLQNASQRCFCTVLKPTKLLTNSGTGVFLGILWHFYRKQLLYEKPWENFFIIFFNLLCKCANSQRRRKFIVKRGQPVRNHVILRYMIPNDILLSLKMY